MAKKGRKSKRGGGSSAQTPFQAKLSEADRAHRDGRLDDAVKAYHEALGVAPDEPVVMVNLAVALRALGRAGEAVGYLERAIELDPANSDAHYNLGNAHRAGERFQEAAASYAIAIERNPDYLFAYSNRALALKDAERFDEAVDCVSAGLQRFPDDPRLYGNLGVVLWAAGRIETAVSAYRRAIALTGDQDPYDNGQAFHNLGAALFKSGCYEEAIEHERRAVDLMESGAESHATIGQCLSSMGRTGEALEAFDAAFDEEPDNVMAHLGRARTLLLMGDLERGFVEYEWRWRQVKSPKPSFDGPEWDGGDLAGRRILLYAEQGLGDTIHAARYIPLVAQAGGVVTVQCPGILAPLIASVEGADRVVATGDPLPPFDCHAPLLSLPKLMATTLDTIPCQIPYLGVKDHANPPSSSALRIGIAWAGNPNHENDANRSCDLTAFLPLMALPGTAFYSLQLGERAADIRSCGCGPFLSDLKPRIANFTDTARFVLDLDLVICVDTALAHLAGALGKPVWVLLPFGPDWRWMLERRDSPWYPTMRLYRQPQSGDWASVIGDIQRDLEARLAEMKTGKNLP